MKHGFLKVACATPKIKVADCTYNVNEIIDIAARANEKKVKVLVFPELCITAYTCGDLFFSNVILDSAMKALKKYIEATRDYDMLSIVGLPMFYESKIYNCAAVVKGGELLGVVAKSNLPTYGEFYEGRYFVPCPEENLTFNYEGKKIPFGRNILFACSNMPLLRVGVEICEDIWVTTPPSNMLSNAGATLLAIRDIALLLKTAQSFPRESPSTIAMINLLLPTWILKRSLSSAAEEIPLQQMLIKISLQFPSISILKKLTSREKLMHTPLFPRTKRRSKAKDLLSL